MILPSGNQSGPYIENSDSRCTDKTYTLFVPGSDGGLVSGGYQPAPNPGFNAAGDSLASKIIQPVKFFGRNFSLSTNPTDLQVGTAVPTPVLRAEGGRLTGDLSAFDATWNNQKFNQGAPKPGGALPGNTKAVDGSYDATTGRFSVTWSSQIVGGPFDNFTGQWHLEGTFKAAGSGAASAAAGHGRALGAGGSRRRRPPPSPLRLTPPPGRSATTGRRRAPAAPAGTDLAGRHRRRVPGPHWPRAPVIIALLGIAAVVLLSSSAPRRGDPHRMSNAPPPSSVRRSSRSRTRSTRSRPASSPPASC